MRGEAMKGYLMSIYPDIRYLSTDAGYYLNELKCYLNNEAIYCKKNKNEYSTITLKYINEILDDQNFHYITPNIVQRKYNARDFKYNNFIESYRLIKYQYSKYSNLHESLVDGVYSSIVLEILKNTLKHNITNILDCGSGPSRLTYELSFFFPKASFTLLDFSYINLFFAKKLLTQGGTLSVPYKAFNDRDTEIMAIRNKNIASIYPFVFNLDNLGEATFQNNFDIITSCHCVNLLSNPLKTIKEMANLLRKGGILVISDLLGWKENRETLRRVFYNKKEFFSKISAIRGLKPLHIETGGPYCEKVNAERFDIYTNHFIVLKKE